MSLPTLADYTDACHYPGRLDDGAVEASLRQYLSALGIERHIVRLRRGWSVDQYPAMQRAANAVLDDFGKRWAAQTDALDALAALDARSTLAAQAAQAERAALDAQTALDARSTRHALAARAALDCFARWIITGSHWWWGTWDLSWLSTTAFGARQLRNTRVQEWAEPVLSAFLAGCWFVYWTDDTLYWVAKPTVRLDDQRRLHCETAPAVVSDAEDLCFWEGTLIPSQWITDRGSLDAATALTWPNMEQRRIACSHIVGWSKILRDLNANVIDADADPMIGTLLEAQLPDLDETSRFCRVLCGTGREFVICVPPTTSSAQEAQAWMQGRSLADFRRPEVRT